MIFTKVRLAVFAGVATAVLGLYLYASSAVSAKEQALIELASERRDNVQLRSGISTLEGENADLKEDIDELDALLVQEKADNAALRKAGDTAINDFREAVANDPQARECADADLGVDVLAGMRDFQPLPGAGDGHEVREAAGTEGAPDDGT